MTSCDENINQFTSHFLQHWVHTMNSIFSMKNSYRIIIKAGWCMDFPFPFVTRRLSTVFNANPKWTHGDWKRDAKRDGMEASIYWQWNMNLLINFNGLFCPFHCRNHLNRNSFTQFINISLFTTQFMEIRAVMLFKNFISYRLVHLVQFLKMLKFRQLLFLSSSIYPVYSLL